ncbi:hypothetical protein OIU79_009590 [Salix purpurea]|uniref:Uncharacterized protein n=1 Tax=Salix purpurea TaxID=77065 RepID=A0A9Q0QE69_SALPP|nr:hypothetical protein OIU79_009590 [Salix purpurea]
MDLGDGVTHSLPHKKYGPYICPKMQENMRSFTNFRGSYANTLQSRKQGTKEEEASSQKQEEESSPDSFTWQWDWQLSPVGTKSKVPLKVYVRRKKAAGGKAEMATSEKGCGG